MGYDIKTYRNKGIKERVLHSDESNHINYLPMKSMC